MARKWSLFYRRIQLFLSSKLKLLIVALLSFILTFNVNQNNKILAKNPEIKNSKSLSNLVEQKTELLEKKSIITDKLGGVIISQNNFEYINFQNNDNQSILVSDSDNNIQDYSSEKLVNLGLELYQQGKFNQANRTYAPITKNCHSERSAKNLKALIFGTSA